MLPAVVLVRHDLAGGIRGGPNFAHMRGTVIVPTVLIPAHELQAHGFAGALREDRGAQRDIVVTAVAVSAGAFVVLDAHLVRGHAEHGGQLAARAVHVLRRALDERGIGGDVGQRAIGPEGRVGLIGSVDLERNDVRRAAESADIAAFENYSVRGFRRSHVIEKASAAGKRGCCIPE